MEEEHPAIAVICRALSQWRQLRFDYDEISRVVEPYCCGRSAEGADVLVAWLTSGFRSHSDVPGWRTFRVGRITNIEAAAARFLPRPGFDHGRVALTKTYCERTA